MAIHQSLVKATIREDQNTDNVKGTTAVTLQSLLAKEPIGYHDQIPLFSPPTDYTDNYAQISSDHLISLAQHGTNPFIPEDKWVDFEHSTSELIHKYSSPGDKVLDVGVGLGRLLADFPLLERYGVDISLGYLNIAREKGIEVCYSLIEDLPFKEETFDLVVCTDVLEHVLDLNLCCSKILAVLKPMGTLIVRVPYRENLSQYLSPDCPYKYVHLRNFDEHSLRLLFEKIFGYQVVEIAKAGYHPTAIKLKRHIAFPKCPPALYKLVKFIHHANLPKYDALLQRVADPIEINVVVSRINPYI